MAAMRRKTLNACSELASRRPERELALLTKAEKRFADAKRVEREYVDTEFEITDYRRR